MPAPVVRTEGLSKKYRLGSGTGTRFSYGRLTESLSNSFRRAPEDDKKQARFIWALKDVSMEVQQGEVVGIIGRNGAGKTTLLKILSRITEPTGGSAELRGRVGSLLEVGTGFHPELTGRENIYLNGAILGMRKSETARRFDEIVAFAEIDKFLDTPVKRYSSGMYIRLAFAVAAHLEPEILIVDEVLSVGDARFQKKCLGRMEEIGSGGRTVLFVSHNTQAVQRLCQRVILLDEGKVLADGDPRQTINRYLDSGIGSSAIREWLDPNQAPGDEIVRLKSVRVRTGLNNYKEEIEIREPLAIEVEYWHLPTAGNLRPTVSIHFYNEEGTCLFASNDFNNLHWWATPRKPGVIKSVCNIPGNFLAEGRIFVLAALTTYNPPFVHAMVRDAVAFQIVDRTTGDGVRGEYTNDWPGVMRPMLDWTVNIEETEADPLLTTGASTPFLDEEKKG